MRACAERQNATEEKTQESKRTCARKTAIVIAACLGLGVAQHYLGGWMKVVTARHFGRQRTIGGHAAGYDPLRFKAPDLEWSAQVPGGREGPGVGSGIQEAHFLANDLS